jgi:hypothetical protein
VSRLPATNQGYPLLWRLNPSQQCASTSSLFDLHHQSSSKSGLATLTRLGRSGADTRPGMVSLPQRTDFVIVPVSVKSKKTASKLPDPVLLNVLSATPSTIPVSASSLAITSQPMGLDPASSTALPSVARILSASSDSVSSSTSQLAAFPG